MPVIKGLECMFNQVYAEYDKWRPTYVPELYADIFAYNDIGRLSNVVEVGIGTGQATAPILERGCNVTAIELGDKLAAFTQQKFSQYANFKIVNTPFQDFECPHNSFDMVYSASAFHWIPEEIGYPKVFAMLKPGGTFARFANHPYKDKGREQLHLAIQRLYAKYMPGSSMSPEYCAQMAQARADVASKYGFTDIAYHLYHRTRTFSGQEYASLLGTYSDHRALEASVRARFFADVRRTIDEFGGKITIYDTLDLELARKPLRWWVDSMHIVWNGIA